MMISQQTVNLLSKGRFETRFLAGRYYVPVRGRIVNQRIHLSFGYNKDLLADIKRSFEERKWEPASKEWSFPITERNIFQFEALQGRYGPDPYSHWRSPVPESVKQLVADYGSERLSPFGEELLPHQLDIIPNMLWRRHYMAAADMGLGKTLCAMLAMELFAKDYPGLLLWVGPRAPLVAVQREFHRWKSPLHPIFLTPEGLKSALKTWQNETPRCLILDESSTYKNPKAQRTQAASYVAKAMREKYGMDCLIILLTGTPAPKAPTDWWSQVEIIQPGFITEANTYLLRERLAVMIDADDGVAEYRKLVRWRNDTVHCKECGAGPTEHAAAFDHSYCPGSNEVEAFGKRLDGIAGVWLKKTWLKLPPLRYEVITIEPSKIVLQHAATILKSTARAADALIRLRSLSDGFIYTQKDTGKTVACPHCDENGEVELTENEKITCGACFGSGVQIVYAREAVQLDTAKLDVLNDILEEHEEVGRLNIYAGFQGSIDLIRDRLLSLDWNVICVDSRGWFLYGKEGVLIQDRQEILTHYQDLREFERLSFVGQPGAAGMGLTLTASPTTVFYSNDFNPQSRLQAVSRGHRIGMDMLRGGRIIDLVHLPSDRKVLESLQLSENLQAITMNQLWDWFSEHEASCV